MGYFRKNMITIMMTNICNLNCRYCYIGDKNIHGQKIDVEFAKQGIKDFFENNENPAVRFFGEGEPIVAFEEIVELKKYADSISKKKVIYEIQTNGVFSHEKAEWLRDNMDVVNVSIDGPAHINSQLRANHRNDDVTDMVVSNIKILLQNPSLRLAVRSTICSINVDCMKEMVDFFAALGVKNMFAERVCWAVGSSGQDISIDPKLFVDRFYEAKMYAQSKGIYYSCLYEINFDEKVCIACRSCLPAPHLTIDKYVSCCDMCVSNDSVLNEMIYGKYNSDLGKIEYFEDRIQNIKRRNVKEMPACKECDIKYHCAGSCFGEALNETGDILGVKQETCEAIKYLWEKHGKQPIPVTYFHP